MRGYPLPFHRMTVIATVGLPGSGKSEAASVARDLSIPVVTMGDVVRAETEARGLDPRRDHGVVATTLRQEDGPAAIAERSLPIIERRLRDHDLVFVDGIRSDKEVDRFKEAFGDDFVLICVDAPFDVREDRLHHRGRDRSDRDGGEELRERDDRELGFGMGAAMAEADIVVENVDSLAAFRDRIRSILEHERDR